MTLMNDISWIVLSLTTLLVVGLLCVCVWQRHALRRARALTEVSREGEVTVTRILRLFAHELNAMVLSMRGQADRLAADAHPSAESVAAIAAQLGALADELAHHLTPVGLLRRVDCEAVNLAALIHESVASLGAILAPGRRIWRVDGPEVEVWADRRALRQVLMRVLGEAVRSTRQNDWIEIRWYFGAEGVVVLVEDEGIGSLQPNGPSPVLESRGLGLRLSLARALVQAHGGTMEVEAQPRIGTRVRFGLPMGHVSR
jgi:signal transduction histidine kinase